MMTSPQTVKMRRKRLLHKPPPENATHCQLADLLRAAIQPYWMWWHTPNGGERPAFINAHGKRVSIEAGRLKRMGVRAGVSDFLLVAPGTAQLHALELKREGKSPTSDQLDFLQSVTDAGGRAEWADSFEEAVEILTYWGAIKGVHP